MNKEKIMQTLEFYKKLLEEKDYNVIYIGLYGSQNYNVDDELSDVDVKAIVLPSLHDVVFRKVTSKVVECENGSIDVKDLMTFYDVIKKGNFSYIECIDSEYWLGDKYIKDLFKQFRPNLKSILGAMHEKRKALTHEYPSKKQEFEKWGFDPKQYHHIIRLHDLLEFITNTKQQASFLSYHNNARNFMIAEKRNKNNYNKAQVEFSSDFFLERAKKMIPTDYKYEPINIDEAISNYIETNLRKELCNI